MSNANAAAPVAAPPPHRTVAITRHVCDGVKMAETMSQRGKAANQMAAALDRWDEEGGAAAMPWPLRPDVDRLADMERCILESLGAALVGEWNSLPTDIQRAIFHRAATDRAHGADELKARIARFLHDHKGACAAL